MKKTLWVSMIMVTGLGACKLVEATDPPADPYANETAFCEALASAVCNEEVVTACYQSTEEQISDDVKSCVKAYSSKDRCNPQGLNYNASGAAACVAAADKAYLDAKLTAEERRDVSDACLAVYSVGGEVGISCTTDIDCDGATGLRCVFNQGAGTCQTPEEVGPGLSCASDSAVCEEGFYCGSDMACIQRPGPAEACSAERPCVESARCVEGLCAPKTANGEACGQDEECQGGVCVKAKEQADGTCGSQLILSPTTAGSCEPFLP